jgi:hypothetical protein
MRRIAIASAGILLATTIAYASPLNLSSPELNYTPIELVQAQKKDAPKKEMPAAKKDETITQKVKRTWRRWTSPSHSFCVRCPIPIPLTSKVCTAKGKTVGEAQSVCQQQNPLCYVTASKC